MDERLGFDDPYDEFGRNFRSEHVHQWKITRTEGSRQYWACRVPDCYATKTTYDYGRETTYPQANSTDPPPHGTPGDPPVTTRQANPATRPTNPLLAAIHTLRRPTETLLYKVPRTVWTALAQIRSRKT